MSQYSLITVCSTSQHAAFVGLYKSIRLAEEAANRQEELIYNKLVETEEIDFPLKSLEWSNDHDKLTEAYAESMLTDWVYHIAEYIDNV
jgi:hypothetical protein